MWYDLHPQQFSDEELFALQSLEGRRLIQVYYSVWKNLTQRGDDYQALDWVELRFEDGWEIAMTAGDNSDGIKVRPYHYERERATIEAQFNGQVALERLDVSQTEVWQGCIGSKLTRIELFEGPDGQAQNNRLQLIFGGLTNGIGLNEEGLYIWQEQ